MNEPYVLDGNSPEYSGNFPCPKCGIDINPCPSKDEEENYKITRFNMRGRVLKSISMECNCGAKIKLKS